MTLHPVIVGDDVVLARLRAEDVPAIARYFQNLELTTYLSGSGMSYSLEDEQAWFAEISRSRADRIIFGIYEPEGRIVGAVELRDIRQPHGTAELGIALYDPHVWGRGYGSQAVQLIAAYGMFHLNLHNILLKVYAFNERGIRAYRRVGFQEIGRRRGAVLLGGQRHDQVFMELLAEQVDVSRLRAQIQQLNVR
ncbi:GNAT family protein [Deinococcus sonorensis]|uniref:GNAT family protein n=2 Tax=Deinococcus sonorensis TaxID=309891 RepID=A0AAU7UAG5_9DEIO